MQSRLDGKKISSKSMRRKIESYICDPLISIDLFLYIPIGAGEIFAMKERTSLSGFSVLKV